MSEDEAFESFYGRLIEIVNAKLNLREKIEDTKSPKVSTRKLLGQSHCHSREQRLGCHQHLGTC